MLIVNQIFPNLFFRRLYKVVPNTYKLVYNAIKYRCIYQDSPIEIRVMCPPNLVISTLGTTFQIITYPLTLWFINE